MAGDLEINVAQAALGDEVVVPTIDGEATLTIDPGTESGKVFRLKHKKAYRAWIAGARVLTWDGEIGHVLIHGHSVSLRMSSGTCSRNWQGPWAKKWCRSGNGGF
ncbi:MAG: hypothetical protein M5U34_46265 [Chloroflexi bacterium]|nr:hypothetical protein [Chloroflexota bacterium]